MCMKLYIINVGLSQNGCTPDPVLLFVTECCDTLVGCCVSMSHGWH